MTTEDFNAVCAPKILGALNLHKALRDQELDFFVLTSSISGGISGWQGQSKYEAPDMRFGVQPYGFVYSTKL